MTETEKAVNYIEKKVLSGIYSPGDKLPSEREFANSLSVSRVTIRRAYEILKSRGVIIRKQGVGTIINTTPQAHTDKIREIALLSTVRNSFALSFVEALESYVSSLGVLFALRITNEYPDQEEKAIVDLVKQGVRNIVVWPNGFRSLHEVYKRLSSLGVNMVFFDRVHPDGYADYVGLDNTHAVNSIIEHALAQGCDQYVFISYLDFEAAISVNERLNAFTSICKARKLSYRVYEIPYEYDQQSRYFDDIISDLTLTPKTAFIGVNDFTVLSLYKKLSGTYLYYGIDGIPEIQGTPIMSFKQPMKLFAQEVVMCLQTQNQSGAAWQSRAIYLKGSF